LLALGVGQDEIFGALTAEATGLIDEPTTLIRFETASEYTVVATSGGPLPLRARIGLGEGNLFAEVLRTRRTARIDGVEHTGRINRTDGRDHDGGSSELGVPIIVGDRLWGVLSATSSDHRLAATVEHRLRQFVGIMAVAVVNGEARGQLKQIAEEQTALRRVAELAAHDAPVEQLLQAVAIEASTLAGVGFGKVFRYIDADGGTQILALGGAPNNFTVGMRAPGTGDGAVHRVWRTGRASRVDDISAMSGRWARMSHDRGFTASAGVPIVMRGALWGALVVTGRGSAFPAALEDHLAHFAELAGTAIAAADAREELRLLADEQAALRRIAELAAQNAPAGDVLQAVAVEAAALAGVEFTTLLRYEPDGSTQIIAVDGAPDGIVPGMRSPGTGDDAVQRVWRTGQPARMDNLAEMSGVWPQLATRHGFNASAAVPIVIRGALWGALVVVGRREAFPLPIEEHLANFAELAGTAVSAADARQELQLLADEQAALRRVAELVARGATLDEVFTAAATEASSLLGELAAALMRYDDSDTAVVVAVCNSPVPLGLGVPIDDSNDLGNLRRTGRPARTDNFAGTSLADVATTFGVGAGVAVPVTVEGRVWGALTASTPDSPLPAGSEERLTPFAELVAAAIGNAQNKAKLTASRARVVATADETRRRLQRDVHDGAQQRLVHTIIALKLARDVLAPEHPAAGLLQEGLSHAERANSELRDIVRGILPASLTHGGLRSGLETLVADLALPVDLTVVTPRLPAHIETTAYFVVAEAMTNVVKHAHAQRATVDVRVDDHTLVVDIRDDGVGGADPTAGSGITGLFDRVEASDGMLTVTSYPGTGTAVHAAIPVREQPTVNHAGDVSLSL
jgi:signal transduction histidine kinase